MECPVIKVNSRLAEEARQWLIMNDLYSHEFKLKSIDSTVLIPVKNEIFLLEEIPYEVIRVDSGKLEKSPIKYSHYTEVIDVPSDVISTLPRAFDIIGNIAVFKHSSDIERYGEKIGFAVCKIHKNIRTVAFDYGVKDDFRVRALKKIYGEEIGEVLHKENGIVIYLNPSEVYYSPRLAGERKRVADLVEDGENILDMFAGVGPFCILMARHKKVNIIANDFNPKAFSYLKKNIASNNMAGLIKPVCVDAANLRLKNVQRIIMNLPHSAFDYLKLAMNMISSTGTIHFYEILGKTEVEKRTEDINNVARIMNKTITLTIHEIRTYSPEHSHYGFDILFSRV